MQKFIRFFMMLASTYTVTFAGISSRDIIIDKQNNIYWQDNLSSEKSSEDFNDAIAYCDRLSIGGLEEWRLPTFQELFSIVDYTRYKPAIDPNFQYTANGTYWTSQTFSSNKSRAWTINFRNGVTYYSYKSTNHGVRCVKDIPTNKKESK